MQCLVNFILLVTLNLQIILQCSIHSQVYVNFDNLVLYFTYRIFVVVFFFFFFFIFRFQSLSLTPARPRPGHHAASGGSNFSGSMQHVDDSDVDSVKSYGSACSTASACDHAHFALNGTTWSGRSKKYVVHCSKHSEDSEQYLTPTQRAARQVRKFQVNYNFQYN